MKTAVEFLASVLSQTGPITEDDFNSLVKQAKEMEKEYKCRFANEYADNVMAGMMKTAEDYLTEYETFKSE